MSRTPKITNPFTGEKIHRDSLSAKLLRRKGWDESSYVRESLGEIPEPTMTLRSHQLKVVNHMKTHRGLLVFHSVGSGKTLTAAIVTRDYLKRKPNGQVFVVTPVSLEENFKKELIASAPTTDIDRYVFLSYDKMYRRIMDGEISCNECCIIIDEAHNLKGDVGGKSNHVRAKSIIEFAKDADRVLLLTATPLVNEPYDIANLISIVKGDDAPSRGYFDYMMSKETIFGDYFRGYISIFDESNLQDRQYYPKFDIKQIYIPMSRDYQKAYGEIEKSEGEKYGFKDPTVFYNGIRRASNNIDTRIESPKTKWVIKFFDSVWKGEKLVIFSNWLEYGIEMIEKLLKDRNVPYSLITGTVKAKARDVAVTDYNSGAKPVLLISKAGGEGLDLKGSRYLIMLDPGWNTAQADQVIGRTVRYMSHEHLDPEERLVKIYRLFLVKDKEFRKITDWGYNNYYDNLENRYRDRSIWSVEMYLRALAISKQKETNELKKRLLPLSI